MLDTAFNRYAMLFGRILIAIIFLVSGFGKVMQFDGTAAYMAAHGLPLVKLLLPLTILLELGGGLLLVLGLFVRPVAVLMFLFLIPVTLVFHPFWSAPADQLQVQTIMFLKNLAIMGGMLYIAAQGAGPLRLSKK